MTDTYAIEAKPIPAGKLLASDPYSRTFGEQWQQNRCTQLLAFACLIFIVGASFLLYRQNKFVPIGFPDGDSIQIPGTEPDFAPIPADSVMIVVVGAQNDRGRLRVAIYDSADGFNDPAQAVRRTSLEIQSGEAVAWVPINTLPETLAIAVFHDENENGELDRSLLGFPTERYGFSNDAREITGPPSFKNAMIDRPNAGQSINISIR